MSDSGRISNCERRVTYSYSPFNTSALIQSIIGKYNEIKENTIFELMQISGSVSISELQEKGYDIKITSEGTKTTISLHYGEKHIITYIIYFDPEGHKIKRDRLVNTLESEDEQ